MMCCRHKGSRDKTVKGTIRGGRQVEDGVFEDVGTDDRWVTLRLSHATLEIKLNAESGAAGPRITGGDGGTSRGEVQS